MIEYFCRFKQNINIVFWGKKYRSEHAKSPEKQPDGVRFC